MIPEFDFRVYRSEEKPKPFREYLYFDNLIIKRGKLGGFCPICGATTLFELQAPIVSEDLSCRNCRSFNRIRQLMIGLAWARGVKIKFNTNLRDIFATFKSPTRILLLEAVTPIAAMFEYYAAQSKKVELYKTEYISGSLKSGEQKEDIMHFDILKSGFDDEFFDIIVHADVFEHVSDAPRAEREQYRLLKKNGFAIYTAPTKDELNNDDIRTRLHKDGSLNKIKSAIYHGDPAPSDLGEAGSIVFRFFSYNDIRKRYLALGADYSCLKIYAPGFGIIGQNNHVHYVKKPKK